MNKILRYSLFVALTLVSTLANAAKDPTDVLDFTKNNWKIPTSNTTAKKQYTDGKYTITLQAPTGYCYKSDGYLLMGKKGATLSLPKFGYKIGRIAVVGRAGGSENVTSVIVNAGTDDAVSYQQTGCSATNNYNPTFLSMDDGVSLKVTNDYNFQITKIMIWRDGSAPYEEIPDAKGFAALKKMKSGTKARIEFDEAIVQYINGSDVFVADKTGGINFYNYSDKLSTMSVGDNIYHGLLIGKIYYYNGQPQIIDTEFKQFSYSGKQTVEPLVVTAATAIKNECRLVKFKNVTPVKEEKKDKNGKVTTTYYLDANKQIQLYNKYKIDYTIKNWTGYDFVGIIVPYNKIYELLPTVAPKAVSTGIDEVKVTKNENGATYNLAGQKVGKDYKGVVLKNGKKYIQK